MDPEQKAVASIRSGDVDRLRQLLQENPGLVRSRADGQRTLLHTLTDWPGKLPRSAEMVQVLVEAGADVDAPFTGSHAETPLHWGASNDDVSTLDALLDHGANLEAAGGVIGGGTPLADAVAFGQWRAARRLVERGAHTNLWQAAALGLLAVLEEEFRHDPVPTRDEITNAFWCACHGGQRATAEYLLNQGADANWIGYDGLTALGAAERSGAQELANWLRSRIT